MINLDNLFFIIKEKGLSASKVSDDTGISTGNISDWKKDDRIRTCYLYTCYCYINEIDVSNAVLRERFGVSSNKKAMISKIIKSTIDAGNSNNIAFGENSSVKITNEEIEKEICKVLSGLNLRERSELLTIIYNFVDEHKSEELK